MTDKKQLVCNFVDGADVSFDLMLSLKLIDFIKNGYVLTEHGKSFLKK
jgi:hypothetical protein